MEDENLETLLTKKEFDDYYKDLLKSTEKTLKTYHKQYLQLLTFRQKYRKDYQTHRIKHYIDNKGFLKFYKLCKRHMGYTQIKDK